MDQSIEQNIISIIEDTVKKLGFDLVKVHLHGTIVKNLEILIDRLDYQKVSIEDCQLVSRNISAVLDVHDVISGKYYLHVASSGIERPLNKIEDYERFVGYHAKIHLKVALDNNKNIQAVIKKVEENKISLQTQDKELVIDFDMIKKAHLVLTDEMFKKLLNKK